MKKRQGTRRVLHFAVTGALLGGMGMGGCASRHKLVNNGPEPEELHVNPGPDEDPGAAEGGAVEGGAAEPAPEPDHVNTAPVQDPPAPAPEIADVNPGPQEPGPAKAEVKYVNTVKTPDPEPAPPKKK